LINFIKSLGCQLPSRCVTPWSWLFSTSDWTWYPSFGVKGGIWDHGNLSGFSLVSRKKPWVKNISDDQILVASTPSPFTLYSITGLFFASTPSPFTLYSITGLFFAGQLPRLISQQWSSQRGALCVLSLSDAIFSKALLV
jgi:hypothetical protein